MCLTAVPTPGCTTPLPNSVREGAGTGGSSTTRAFLDFHTGADHNDRHRPQCDNIKGPGSLAAEPRSPAPYLSPTLSRT
jgi:hypothetical protein